MVAALYLSSFSSPPWALMALSSRALTSWALVSAGLSPRAGPAAASARPASNDAHRMLRMISLRRRVQGRPAGVRGLWEYSPAAGRSLGRPAARGKEGGRGCCSPTGGGGQTFSREPRRARDARSPGLAAKRITLGRPASVPRRRPRAFLLAGLLAQQLRRLLDVVGRVRLLDVQLGGGLVAQLLEHPRDFHLHLLLDDLLFQVGPHLVERLAGVRRDALDALEDVHVVVGR